MTPLWTNEPERLDLKLIHALDVAIPLYLLGDHTGSTFTARFEDISDGGGTSFSVATPSFPESLPEDDGLEYTLVEVSLDSDDLTVAKGDLYRWCSYKDGVPMVGGRMSVVEQT